MPIFNQSDLLLRKTNVQQTINTEIDPQTPPDTITAAELNAVLTEIMSLIEDDIQSGYNVLDKIEITNVYQGTTSNTLDLILQNYQPLINPINTAFNKNFGTGGNSTDVPRFDDPRFSNERIPINNSVSTIKIQDNSVTNTKLSDMPTLTLKGNDTGITANPQDLTPTQVRTILNIEEGAQVNLTAKNSITIDLNEYQLVNDELAPGNWYYYGTNDSGTKGYFTLESAINNYVTAPNGDGWGSDRVDITTDITNPDTTNSFTVLSGDGRNPTPLALDGTTLRDFVNDVISVTVNGDDWGSQVVELVAGGGLVGDGTSLNRLGLNIISNTSLTGVGTTASNLAVDENWLSTYISDYITNNGADDWGNQVAFTSGLLIGDGLAGNRIRLANGSGVNNELALWDFTQQIWKLVDSAGFANEFLNVNTSSPVVGNGTVATPITLEDGLVDGNILQWDGVKWSQVLLDTEIDNRVTVSNGLSKDGTNDIELGGVLEKDTVINGTYLFDIKSSLSTYLGSAQTIETGFKIGEDVDGGEIGSSLYYLDTSNFNRSVVHVGIDPYILLVSVDGNTNDTGKIIISPTSVDLRSDNILIGDTSGLANTSLLKIVQGGDSAYIGGAGDKGILYVGAAFHAGGPSIEANYDPSNLVYNSLVPKKYVDDKASVYTQTIPSLDISTYAINHNLDSTDVHVQIKVFLSGTEYIVLGPTTNNRLGLGETIVTKVDTSSPNSLTVECDVATAKEAIVIVKKII